MEAEVYDLLSDAVRVALLIMIPVTAAAFLAGLLSSFLQVITTLQDSVFSYCFRLLACVMVIGMLSVSFSRAVAELLIGALQ